MCLAIYKPVGAEVSEEYLRNGFDNHSDGAGFAWSADGQLHVVKGIFNVEKMIEQYNKIKQYACLIHFRKATHGKIDKTNCHPFLFNDGKLALIHNGVLPIKCSIDGLSDTAHYVKLVLEPMVKRNKVPINDVALQYLLATSIGTDKMAIMDCDGNTYVINEDKGTWEGGVWYSNTSFQHSYKTYSTNHQGSQTYLSRAHGGSSSGGSSDSYRNNWRKRFDESPEGDDAYLEFWRRVAENSEFSPEGACCSLKKTQKIPTSRSDTIDDAGNVKIIDVEEVDENEEQSEAEEQYGPGMMCDYGWWDEEIEADIEKIRKSSGCNREQAIIRVFNPS